MGSYNVKKKCAVLAGSAALAVASNAYGFGMMEVGDWEVEFGGNVNGYYNITSCKTENSAVPTGGAIVGGGLACGSNGLGRDVNAIQTGLLPSWFGFTANTQQAGYDIGITIGFQPGIDSGNAAANNSLDTGLALNSSNFRQVFLKFGQESWGQIKVGRDLGIFGADAILSDMTLLGVGTVGDGSAGGANTTLGRIGVGYPYADWRAQITYTTPKFGGGFSGAIGLFDPWALVAISNNSAGAVASGQKTDVAIQGKVDYGWEGGPANTDGKVWLGFQYQGVDFRNNQQGLGGQQGFDDDAAWGFEGGIKAGVAGFEGVVYGYTGSGMGTTTFGFGGWSNPVLNANGLVVTQGQQRDSNGGYVQGTYKFPGWGTKLGASWGISRLDLADGENGGFLVQNGVLTGNANNTVSSNSSWIVGLYHPLTEALHLVAEYTQTTAKAWNSNEAEENNLAFGAILFY